MILFIIYDKKKKKRKKKKEVEEKKIEQKKKKKKNSVNLKQQWWVYQNKSLTFRGNKLSHGQRASTSGLHELHLGDDDVVLQHGAAAHADGIAARRVHIDVRAAAMLAHLGAHVATQRARPLVPREGRALLPNARCCKASVWLARP